MTTTYEQGYRIDCWQGYTGLWFWQVHKHGQTLSYHLPNSKTQAVDRQTAMHAARTFIQAIA